MRKSETLEKFAKFTLTEGKYPTLDTFMSWGFGRSTYYKIKNRYEIIAKTHQMVQDADVWDTVDGAGCWLSSEERSRINKILRNPVYSEDYLTYERWMKECFSNDVQVGF